MDKVCPERIPYQDDPAACGGIDCRDGPMNTHAATSASSPATPLPLGRLLLIAVALLVALACGCSRLRLPAIDPTGSCLFTPPPTTTTLALPCLDGEGCGCFGCLQGLGCKKKGFAFPEPAFPEPSTPPSCPTPAPPPVAAGQSNEPCVPSAACNGSCKDGPPAVLYGQECNVKKIARLPNRGKRGCILLSPDKDRRAGRRRSRAALRYLRHRRLPADERKARVDVDPG